MSTQVLRLATQIVREDFGDFVAKVASVLFAKGRQSLPQIRTLAKLTLKQTKEALFVLCQHHLVTWAEATEPGGRVTIYYVASESWCLRRLLNARIFTATEEWLGKDAVAVVKVVLKFGRITLPVALEQIEQDRERGLLKSKAGREKFIEVFNKLVSERFLTCDIPENAITVDDKNMASDAREMEKLSALPTAKAIKEIKDARKQRAEMEAATIAISGMKRKLAGEDGTGSKKRRTGLEYVDEVDEDAFWIINYDIYLIRFRNKEVVNMVNERINIQAAAIVGTLLQLGEDRMKTCRGVPDDEGKSPAMGSHLIAHALPLEVDLAAGIFVDPDSYDQPNYLVLLTDVLCNDQSRIFLKADEKGGGTYQVHLQRAADNLKQKAIESIIQEKFGSIPCRLVRILQTKGKLEEKQIAKLAMLPLKDTRERLLQLAARGAIELQEVPKSADRTPSRSYYLWYFSYERFCDHLQVDLYRTLGNLRTRRRTEQQSRSRLIAKTERLDVQENPDLLTDADRTQLSELETVLNQIEAQELRIEHLIRLLRDY